MRASSCRLPTPKIGSRNESLIKTTCKWDPFLLRPMVSMVTTSKMSPIKPSRFFRMRTREEAAPDSKRLLQTLVHFGLQISSCSATLLRDMHISPAGCMSIIGIPPDSHTYGTLPERRPQTRVSFQYQCVSLFFQSDQLTDAVCLFASVSVLRVRTSAFFYDAGVCP